MLIRRVVLTLFAAALIAPSTAAAIPTDGNGPEPNAWPVARLSAPDAALLYATVRLDASASFDTDGQIVKYEWDLDGVGGFERTTTTPRTSKGFGAYLNFTVRVRVTDNRGAKSTASRVIRVHPAPRAVFFVVPGQPTAGQTATLVAKESYASGGTPKLDWDLDGNGTYETPSPRGGYEPMLRTSFPTAGQRTVGLRVTDRDGFTATTAVTFTVKRASPLDGSQAPAGGVLSAS
jgi:PKD domain